MDSNSDPIENLDPSLSDVHFPHQPGSEDINKLISDSNIGCNINSPDIPPEADISASRSINPILSYSRSPFVTAEPNTSVHDSRNDSDKQITINKAKYDSLPVTRSWTDKSSQSSIALSNSAIVPTSESRKLQLPYPLEQTYRPRYKSDYFPQNGIVRRPRYIADNAGNHFITLQLPTAFSNDFNNCYIRVALITKCIEGHGHYYSPYKFQKDPNDIKVPDENPIYIKVEISPEDNFMMRLQLVLIKSKSDQLNHVQPLKLFTDAPTTIRNIVHEGKLAPKDLITKYQLDQSQIAFTLCRQFPDGSTELYTGTTVISSVIAEASSSKKTNESTATTTAESTHDILCPHCAHRFETDAALGSEESAEPKPTNSKAKRSRTQTTTEKGPNKKKKNA